jgi:putative copper export protein
MIWNCQLQFAISMLLKIVLGLGLARPATPCAQIALAAPPVIPATQAISSTVQTASSLFVCRVDGAGLLASGAGASTRGLTSAGLALLVLARWLHFAGYALGFGAVVFGLWAGADLVARPAIPARLWRLVSAGIALLLCAEPLALLAQTLGVGGAPFDLAAAGDVLASGFGLVWAQRVGVALLLWVIAGAVHDGTARAVWAVPVLGLVLAVVDAAAGGRTDALGVGAAALHQAAMGAWVGGLALLLASWRLLGHDWQVRMVARFRELSAAAIGVLVVSGMALAALLPEPAALLGTFYGAVLAAKLLAALVAIGLVGFGSRALRDLWRWGAALAALVVVLGVAGLLVSLPAP